MSSRSDAAETQAFLERLISSRNRDISLFIRFLLGIHNTTLDMAPGSSPDPADPDSTNPDQDSPDHSSPEGHQRERIILINPLTQGMVVIEGTNLDSLMDSIPFLGKDAQPPASKASIAAMPSVEVGEEEGKEACAICLEEWEAGGVAKEMPCKHRFHGGCIEKWLQIHGSCPVCRYKMPVEEEEDDDGKKSGVGVGGGGGVEEEERQRRRRGESEIWVSFAFSGLRRRSEESVRTESIDSDAA
ncbi:hypothetical protein Dimus_014908 [Dionaea muscipula]